MIRTADWITANIAILNRELNKAKTITETNVDDDDGEGLIAKLNAMTVLMEAQICFQRVQLITNAHFNSGAPAFGEFDTKVAWPLAIWALADNLRKVGETAAADYLETCAADIRSGHDLNMKTIYKLLNRNREAFMLLREVEGYEDRPKDLTPAKIRKLLKKLAKLNSRETPDKQGST